jgi:hypothetical protein
MKIRLAASSDASAVANLIFQSFLEYRSSYTDEAFAATCPSSIEVENRMSEGPIWMAIEEETVVGTVSGVPVGNALLVRSLAVLPRERTGNRGTTPGSSRELRLRKRLHALSSKHDSLPNSCNPLVRTVWIPTIQRRSQRPAWDANLHNGKRTEIKSIVSSLLKRVGEQEFSDSESNESRN